MTRFVSWLAIGAIAALAAGCGGSGDSGCPMAARLDPQRGLVLSGACGAAELALWPRAKVDGTWVDAADCTSVDAGLRCQAGAAGELELNWEDGAARLHLRPAGEGTLEALSLEGEARLPDARAWLSNGFQSWSQSGLLALAPPVTEAELSAALAAQGDSETLRSGRELSWWLTAVGGGGAALVAGVLEARIFRSFAQVSIGDAPDRIRLRLVCGGTEHVALHAGHVVDSEPWRIELGEEVEPLLERYGRTLPARRRTVEAKAAAGWNSWYELWSGVDEAAVRAHAPLVRAALSPRLPAGTPLRIVIDDGWQQAWGEWLPNEKFPSGLDGLARDFKVDGFEVGVWFAPLLVDEQSAVYREHPEWLVGGASFDHSHGRTWVLDVTHPGAAAHLAETVRRIVSWGYDFLKIDFLFAGTYEGTRLEPVTGMEAFGRALAIIRQAAGEQTIIVAVGAPPVPVLPTVDGWRLGGDIAWGASGPSWHLVVNQARSIAARWPYCLACLCDPDPVLLRAPLSRPEVEAGAWVVALAGGAWFLSDDLRALDSVRLGWGLDEIRAALSLGGQPARPLDFFPDRPPERLSTGVQDVLLQQNTHVLPSRWRLPDGRRVFFNWTEEEQHVEGTSVPAHGAALLAEEGL